MIIKSRLTLLVLQIACTLFAIVFLSISLIRPDWLGVPWYFRILAFIPAAILGLYAVKLSDEDAKQKIRSHFSGRPVLNENEFGQRYFSSDRIDVAAKLRKILARHVDIDLSPMQPSDRFIEDLRMDDLDSMSTVEFVIEVEKEFGIKIPDADAEKMLTFQSVVDCVAEAIKAKAV